MSQYKGYYTAGSSSSKGQSWEAGHYRPGGRGLSQEQDCTEYDDGNGTAEYDNGDGTEYDLGDPGGTSAMSDGQLSRSRSNTLFGKRIHDEADLQADRLDQVQQPQKLLKTSNGAFSRSSNYYSAPEPQTSSTVKDWQSSEMSEWQKERERRREELLAKRSKVMNRLLELRLEQEGEGELDTRDKKYIYIYLYIYVYMCIYWPVEGSNLRKSHFRAVFFLFFWSPDPP